MSACTCNRKFLDAEDFRDHLPCEGTVEQQLRRERDALAARLDDRIERVAELERERDAAIERLGEALSSKNALAARLAEVEQSRADARNERDVWMRRAKRAEQERDAQPVLTPDEWRVVVRALRLFRSDPETTEPDEDIETASRIIGKLAKETSDE